MKALLFISWLAVMIQLPEYMPLNMKAATTQPQGTWYTLHATPLNGIPLGN
jgi:hypothetical protein